MLDRLDDPTPFIPDEQFRSGVDRRARKLKFRRRMLTTSLVSVVLIAGLAVSALAYVVRRDAAIDRIPITMQPSTDGATNLLDYSSFSECLGGPDVGALSGCECFDADGSGTVDLRDFAATQAAYSGSEP